MPTNPYAVWAALSAALAVLIGAFAAHGLKPILSAYQLAIIDTGVQYQFYHALALLVVALFREHLMQQQQETYWLTWSARAFSIGMLCFSGSLYLLALTGARSIGMLTPVGGVAFIVGWVMIAAHCWTNKGKIDAS